LENSRSGCGEAPSVGLPLYAKAGFGMSNMQRRNNFRGPMGTCNA
jgi:hypothetical protein